MNTWQLYAQYSTVNIASPLQDAKLYCEAGYDRDGFSVKYLSDYKGMMFAIKMKLNSIYLELVALTSQN